MLVQDGQRFRFASETALEDFVTQNLKPLWGFDLVARQFQVDGEICDVLAADESHRPVIIELKNTEDRYVVQQVTRYFHALTAAKPFPDRIDWSRAPRLVILSPSFHRHNLIDREYCTLPIQFKAFKVLNTVDGFTLAITALDETARWQHPIPFTPLAVAPPDAPKQVLDWLGPCPDPARQSILELRGKLLQRPDISETIDKSLVLYGNRKKTALEIRFHKGTQQPVLFCWIPTFISMGSQNEKVRRHRLWIGKDHQPEYLGHIPEGWGQMKTKEEWERIPREKWPVKTLRYSITFNSHTPVGFGPNQKNFLEGMKRKGREVHVTDSWSILAEMVLAAWESGSKPTPVKTSEAAPVAESTEAYATDEENDQPGFDQHF